SWASSCWRRTSRRASAAARGAAARWRARGATRPMRATASHSRRRAGLEVVPHPGARGGVAAPPHPEGPKAPRGGPGVGAAPGRSLGHALGDRRIGSLPRDLLAGAKLLQRVDLRRRRGILLILRRIVLVGRQHLDNTLAADDLDDLALGPHVLDVGLQLL